MKVAVASDHGGFDLKAKVVQWAAQSGHEVADLGPDSPEAVDYPDYAGKLAARVASGEFDRGILICGTGIGMSMAANRVSGIRAALCIGPYMAEMSRRHNDANVLCLGGRVIGPGAAEATVRAFLSTPFDGGRHERRVHKIMALDKGKSGS